MINKFLKMNTQENILYNHILLLSRNKLFYTKYNLSDNNVAYIGDDLIDLAVMKKVACPIAVKNAVALVKEISIFVTKSSGGEGAFRDAVEWIVNQQGRMEEVFKKMENHVLSR